VKFLRDGMKLYIGIQSDDKKIGRFGDSWEGDGLFMMIKDASANLREFHVYYNDDTRAGTPKADSAVVESGGAHPVPLTQWKALGLVNTPGSAYDTNMVGTGYKLEAEIRLDSLGFTSAVDSIQVMIGIFDPDGYAKGSTTAAGAFYKTWWGSEWGTVLRVIKLEPQRPYDDPPVITAKNIGNYGQLTIDGKMSSPLWSLAYPYLKFGPYPQVAANELSVTGGAEVRGEYWDPSYAKVKFLRQGMTLYIGIKSDDASIGKFGDSWEGDGLFMLIKDASANMREFHVYYNDPTRVGTPKADSAVVESGGGNPVPLKNWSAVGLVNTSGTAYDTTKVGTGYTLELAIKLDSLGFTSAADTIQCFINIFDPDGYPATAMAYEGPLTRSYHKSWWGSEWGSSLRKIYLEKLATYNNPPSMLAKAVPVANSIVVNGVLNEADWANAKPYLKFGPNPVLTSDERSVTDGALVRGDYWDPSYAKVKFLRKGMSLYIGIQSDDKSIGRFGDSWEGDGLFMEIKDAVGHQREYHLKFNVDTLTGAKADSAVPLSGGTYPVPLSYFKAVGLVNAGGHAYDTSTVSNGYTMELEIRLDSLGFASTVDSVQVIMNIFDPDGYPRGAKAYEGPLTRAYYKTWWGSEWGSTFATIKLDKTTGVAEQQAAVPTSYALLQNYPNPFNPSTTISFDVPEKSFVTVIVYDMLGREVQTLVRGEYNAGHYPIRFNGVNLASGVYFYRMTSNSLGAGHGTSFAETKKLMMLK
jgi:hypothetical protein